MPDGAIVPCSYGNALLGLYAVLESVFFASGKKMGLLWHYGRCGVLRAARAASGAVAPRARPPAAAVIDMVLF